MMSAHELMHCALGASGFVSIKIKGNGIIETEARGMCFFLNHYLDRDLTVIVTNFHIMEYLLDKTDTVLWINGKIMEKKNIYCDSSHDLAFIIIDPMDKKIDDDKILGARIEEDFIMNHLKTKILSKYSDTGASVFTMRRDTRGIKFCHGHVKKHVKGNICRNNNSFTINTLTPISSPSDLLILKIEGIGPGFSGAPVINYSGQIIGMIIGSRDDECTALGIGTVFKCLSETMSKGMLETINKGPKNPIPMSRL
jgi:hypothetical protein